MVKAVEGKKSSLPIDLEQCMAIRMEQTICEKIPAFVPPQETNNWLSYVTEAWKLDTPAEELHVMFADACDRTWNTVPWEDKKNHAYAQKLHEIPSRHKKLFRCRP